MSAKVPSILGLGYICSKFRNLITRTPYLYLTCTLPLLALLRITRMQIMPKAVKGRVGPRNLHLLSVWLRFHS